MPIHTGKLETILIKVGSTVSPGYGAFFHKIKLWIIRMPLDTVTITIQLPLKKISRERYVVSPIPHRSQPGESFHFFGIKRIQEGMICVTSCIYFIILKVLLNLWMIIDLNINNIYHYSASPSTSSILISTSLKILF